MKPLRLTIKGLYSYRRETTIDFTRLTGARLFGIFGPVGSGKSSIIEAITFALYGRNERLNQREQSLNMLNLRSGELLIEFIFSFEGETYKFRVSEKRRKNFNETTNWDKQAYKLTEGEEWVPLFARNREVTAENILGLSYENFKRAIIIPQGFFQEFIQLGGRERTEMMKELFGLEKFDLYERTASLIRENDTRLTRTETRMAETGGIDSTAIAGKEEEHRARGEKLLQLKEELSLLRREEKQLQEEKTLRESLLQARSRMETLSAGKDEITRREERLNRFKLCGREIRPLLLALESRETERDQTALLTEQLKRETESLRKEVREKEEEFRKAEEEWQRRDLRKREIEQLERLLSLEEIGEKKKKREAALEELEKTWREEKAKLEDLNTSLGGMKEEIRSLKSRLLPGETVTRLTLWYDRYASLQTAAAGTEIKREKLRSSLRDEAAALFPEMEEGSLHTEEILPKIDKEENLLETKRNALEEELARYEEEALLSRFTESLSPGEPCPLCGSVEHPRPFSGEAEARRTEQIREEKRHLTKRKEECLTARSRIELIVREESSLKEEVRHSADTLREHKETFQWDDFSPDDPEPFRTAAEETEKNSRIITRLEEETDALEKERDTRGARIAEEEEKTGELKREIISLGEKEILLKDSLTVEYPGNGLGEREKLEETLKEKREALERNDAAYASLGETFKRVKEKLDLSAGRLEEREQQLQRLEEQTAQGEEALLQALEEHGFSSREEAGKILKEIADPEKEEEEIRHFHTELKTAADQFRELLQKTEGKEYDEAALSAVTGKIGAAEEAYQKETERLGALGEIIRDMRKKYETLRELEKEKRELEARGEDLKVFKKLFTAQGFVNFISTRYLRELCGSANRRFSTLTGRSLQLELTEENTFQVRDFLNGGRTRSVKTLSGGQTFQAAFSLALALADGIRSGEENFFFLDEGFGTLDQESLRTIFTTLKSLRKEKRTVGIISHVEELKEEIETYISVENTEEAGSLLTMSWE